MRDKKLEQLKEAYNTLQEQNKMVVYWYDEENLEKLEMNPRHATQMKTAPVVAVRLSSDQQNRKESSWYIERSPDKSMEGTVIGKEFPQYMKKIHGENLNFHSISV